MEELFKIPWNNGSGNIVISKSTKGTIYIGSDEGNTSIDREQVLIFRTLDNSCSKELLVRQLGTKILIADSNGNQLADSNGNLLSALK